MPNKWRSAAAPLGLLLGFSISIITYLSQMTFIYPRVFTTYFSLIDPYQLHEVAWLLGTLDYLLDLSLFFSLVVWIIVAIFSAVFSRHLSTALKMAAVTVLLPSGAWCLFAIKYAVLGGFSIPFLFSFLTFRILFTLCLSSVLAGFFSIPAWVNVRRRQRVKEAPIAISFKCSNCDTEYESKPLICVQCGKEGTIHEK